MASIKSAGGSSYITSNANSCCCCCFCIEDTETGPNRQQREGKEGSQGRKERTHSTQPKKPTLPAGQFIDGHQGYYPVKEKRGEQSTKKHGALSLVTYLKRKYKRNEALMKRRIVKFCAKETYLSCVLCSSGQGKRKYSPSLRAIVFLPSSPP